MFNNLKIWYHQGKQFIPDVRNVKVPGIFRGRPVISIEKVNETELLDCCPTQAITAGPVAIDLGRCTFCGECARLFPEKIVFTTDYKLSTNVRERLIVKEGIDQPIELDKSIIPKEFKSLFGSSLKLRQVSAGGDNSCEWELNAANNVQFDMSRFGIEFVASPRHADGVAITGPITANMAEPLQICYDATPDPKMVILVGTDAISGGVFEGGEALDRSFLVRHKVDLYIAGNPAHPLTVINGLLALTGRE
jgi:Ni,Fe-hydrogenase III small subunit